jgi:hypothetical protein
MPRFAMIRKVLRATLGILVILIARGYTQEPLFLTKSFSEEALGRRIPPWKVKLLGRGGARGIAAAPIWAGDRFSDLS